MDDRLHYDDSCQPAVEKVEGVVADVQQWNEWIIAHGEEDRGYKVADCQCPAPSAEFCESSSSNAISIIENEAENDVAQHVEAEKYKVEA